MPDRILTTRQTGHVFGQPSRREQCYDNLRISKNAWDTNLVKCNPKYLSVNWEASGGGAFAVIPLEERGKLPEVMQGFGIPGTRFVKIGGAGHLPMLENHEAFVDALKGFL